MALRREMLERELRKLGFRKTEVARGQPAPESQQEGQTGHPQAAEGAQHGS